MEECVQPVLPQWGLGFLEAGRIYLACNCHISMLGNRDKKSSRFINLGSSYTSS